jgi:hypothetical protein
MNIDLKNCKEEELWKYVAVHLKKHNIDTILVGGAVVSIYSEGAYRETFLPSNNLVIRYGKYSIGSTKNSST